MILGAVGATTGVLARFLCQLLVFELTAQMILHGYSTRQKFWPWHAALALGRPFCI